MGIRAGRKQPRFVYISDESARAAMLEAARPASRVCWRVMAANNRALGRSWILFPSLATCRAAALTLQRRIDEVSAVTVMDESAGHWSWTIALEAIEVAVCVHPFQRRVDCLRALQLFVEAVRASDPSAAELRYFGPSSLRSYGRGVEAAP